MSEPMTGFEQRLADAVRDYLDRLGLDAPAASVVADVTGRPPVTVSRSRRLAAAVLVASLAVFAVGGLVIAPRLLDFGQGSLPATATVDGRGYFFGAASGMIIDQADLQPVGEISAASDRDFVGATAYQLPGVDPAEALVTPAQGTFAPEPIEWALLFREQQGPGRWSDAYCSYFRIEARSEDGCPADIGIVRSYPAEELPRPYDWWGIRHSLDQRGFELHTPTAAEAGRSGLIAPDELTASLETAGGRIVSIHLAAVSRAFDEVQPPILTRPPGRDLERELMYIVETTGHATGNCFWLVTALRSGGPTFEACEFTDRGDPADATPAPPTPTPSPTPVGFDFEGRLAPTLGTGCVRVAGYGTHVALVGLPRGYWLIEDDNDVVHVAGPLGIVASTGTWIGLRGEFVGESADCPGLRTFRATELQGVDEPEPADGGPVAVQPISSHTYRLGGTEVTIVRELVPGLGWPTFGDPRVVDEGVLALVHRDPDTGEGTLWLADLAAGRLTQLLAAWTTIDGRDGRLLVGEREGLSLYELRRPGDARTLAGRELRGAFLADGRVVAWTRDQIGLWDPDDDTVSWSPLPRLGELRTVSAIGTNVAVLTDTIGVLLDPRTGQELGSRWRVGAYDAAVSPDGTRFVIAVATDGPAGALELRDAMTGEVLAVNAGVELGREVELAWPTPDLIVVMRAPTATEPTVQPELLLASDFTARPLPIDAFVPQPFALSVGAGQLVAVDGFGDLVVISFAEAISVGEWQVECDGVPTDDCRGVAALFANNLGRSGQSIFDQSGGRLAVSQRPNCQPLPPDRPGAFACWEASAQVDDGGVCMVMARAANEYGFGRVGGDIVGHAGPPPTDWLDCLAED